MIKWKIKYTDYNDEVHEEEFYFNLNKAEVMEMDLNANGAYSEYLQRIVDTRDGQKIAEEFKNLILKSYGEKSPDGRRFIKSEEKSREFAQTEAYSELYIQLATEQGAAEKFVSGVLPKIDQSPVPDSK